jgi:hypothetical protein
MSYDLYFKPRNGAIDEGALARYFSAQKNFKIDLPQVLYENRDTGVYFVIELQTQADEPGEEYFPLALNINYFRPDFFILEAEPEITRFVAEFDLTVSDPQLAGMGEGEYSAERLLSGWRHGNEFGHSSILADPANHAQVHSLPSSVTRDAWRWNFGRDALQEAVGESKYVPPVTFLLLDGKVVTVTIWPDGIPVVMPQVDYLFIGRKELAPRRFFRKEQDHVLLAWDDALPVLKRHSSSQFGAAISLDYDQTPKDVVAFVQSLPKYARELSGISPDRVLDRELVEKHMATPI